MNRMLWVGLFSVMTTVSFAAEQRGDWPQWRGPNRDNQSSQQGLLTDWGTDGPALLWQMQGLGGGYASVSVVGDRLYTTGNVDGAQHTIAIDLPTQKIVWSVPVTEKTPEHGYEGSRCTPTVDGDLLYVVSSDGAIVCQKTSDGSIVWGHKFSEYGGEMMSGWGFSECPLVDGPNVLCTPGANGAMIVCLDKKTGKGVWKTAMRDEGHKGAGYSSIVVSNAAGVKQYVQLVGRGLIGVRASNGEHLWTYGRISNPVANIPTPIVKDDYVFGSTGYSEGGSALLKLERNGKGVKFVEQWYQKADELQNHHGGMVLVGDHLYFGNGHNNGFPVCVEMLSGNATWGRQRGAGSGSAAITYADGHVIFRYQSGEVALIEANPAGMNLKSQFMPAFQERESWSQPVVTGGKLYLREQGTLMCYQIAKD